MDLIVLTPKRVAWGDRQFTCAIGRTGHTTQKHEGDGATPVGGFPFRRLLYRPDRLPPPATLLPKIPMTPDDGWCDAPGDPNYNRPVSLPYPASAERLWRDDHLYDLIVVLGHNDDPPVSGLGSAIFLHVASPGYGPTQGCVALSRVDLLAVIAGADTTSQVIVNNFSA
ncbi:MAG: L,D-transpeptidase family protein [Alphaproteobacteria bacterium]